MTNIVRVDGFPQFAPSESRAAADRLISGDPAFKTWELDRSDASRPWTNIRTGIWEATEGETRSIKGGTFEFCHILSGKAEIIEDGGEAHVFGAGDSFVMKPDFKGVWKTLETVRKIFVIAAS